MESGAYVWFGVRFLYTIRDCCSLRVGTKMGTVHLHLPVVVCMHSGTNITEPLALTTRRYFCCGLLLMAWLVIASRPSLIGVGSAGCSTNSASTTPMDAR